MIVSEALTSLNSLSSMITLTPVSARAFVTIIVAS